MRTKAFCAVILAAVIAGTALASTAAAQDDQGVSPNQSGINDNSRSDSDSQPRWRARTAALEYPDDQQPVRTASATDDEPHLAPPAPVKVDSPSNGKPKRIKARVAGEATDAPSADGPQETVPAPRGMRSSSANISRGEMVPPNQMSAEAGEDPDGAIYGQNSDDDFGVCVPNMRSVLHNHLWVRTEALLWWLKGGQAPALLTTSPAGTPLSQAGVLGQPGTTVLVGDEGLNPGLHAGGRISFGTWLGNSDQSGLEVSYMIMGQNRQSFGPPPSGVANGILARPFFDTQANAESSQVILYPNVWGSGTVLGSSVPYSFNVTSTESFQGAEALWRRAIVNGGDGRIDMLVGYRYARLSDGLLIGDTTVSSGSAAIAPGTEFQYADSFHTQNNFNGGDLGFDTQWRRGRWKLDALLKMGIGNTNTQVSIDGSTAITTSLGRNVYSGGILALASNSGVHESNQFSVMPEVGFTLSYDLTARLTASIGYTLLYWSDVARPGDQIDLNVDSAQFPSGANPTPTAAVNPAFALHTSDFWAQGVNLGLNFRF